MHTFARRAIRALRASCAITIALLLAMAAVGTLNSSTAAATGRAVSHDEVATEDATAQAIRAVADAYAAGQVALVPGNPAGQAAIAQLQGTLITQADAAVLGLVRLHARDTGGEAAAIARVAEEWVSLRQGLEAVSAPSGSRTAWELSAAYDPLDGDMQALLAREPVDAAAATAASSRATSRRNWIVGALVAVGAVVALGSLGRSTRRLRRSLEPAGKQAEFADTLQLAVDEVEAHTLLQRHLERSVPGASAVVLNRNNSADRLEAVTALRPGSRLGEVLTSAEPTSCMAVRSARPYRRGGGVEPLIECSVCTACDGASTCAPLTVGGEVIGSVLLEHDRVLADDELQRTQESVAHAAPVLANLRNLAVAELRAATDGLTGLPNKRAVTDTSKRLFAQALATGQPLGLVLLDLDHFKDLNDRHGHPVGDQALAAVGAVLRANLRPSDFAGRNGGEEFAILLPGAVASVALEVAERVRKAIAEIRLPGTDVRVSASLGVAAYPEHAGSLERLERLADGALYLGKQSGRDRCVLARSDAGPGELPDTLVDAAGPLP